MDTVLASLIGRGTYNPSAVGITAYYDSLPYKFRVIELFDRSIKSIHINVNYLFSRLHIHQTEYNGWYRNLSTVYLNMTIQLQKRLTVLSQANKILPRKKGDWLRSAEGRLYLSPFFRPMLIKNTPREPVWGRIAVLLDFDILVVSEML
jgi:hypothetical protein